MLGRIRPIPQEVGRGVKLLRVSDIARIARKDSLQLGARFTPLAATAMNISDEAIRFRIVRQKPACGFQLWQGPVKIAVDAIQAKPFG